MKKKNIFKAIFILLGEEIPKKLKDFEKKYYEITLPISKGKYTISNVWNKIITLYENLKRKKTLYKTSPMQLNEIAKYEKILKNLVQTTQTFDTIISKYHKDFKNYDRLRNELEQSLNSNKIQSAKIYEFFRKRVIGVQITNKVFKVKEEFKEFINKLNEKLTKTYISQDYLKNEKNLSTIPTEINDYITQFSKFKTDLKNSIKTLKSCLKSNELTQMLKNICSDEKKQKQLIKQNEDIINEVLMQELYPILNYNISKMMLLIKNCSAWLTSVLKLKNYTKDCVSLYREIFPLISQTYTLMGEILYINRKNDPEKYDEIQNNLKNIYKNLSAVKRKYMKNENLKNKELLQPTQK